MRFVDFLATAIIQPEDLDLESKDAGLPSDAINLLRRFQTVLEDKRIFEHPRKDYVVMQLEMIMVGHNFLHQMNNFLKMGDGPSAVLDMDPDSSFLYSVLQLGKKLHDLATHFLQERGFAKPGQCRFSA